MIDCKWEKKEGLPTVNQCDLCLLVSCLLFIYSCICYHEFFFSWIIVGLFPNFQQIKGRFGWSDFKFTYLDWNERKKTYRFWMIPYISLFQLLFKCTTSSYFKYIQFFVFWLRQWLNLVISELSTTIWWYSSILINEIS